jgi:hypothetical protein
VTEGPDVRALLAAGIVVITATADSELVPAVARSWGPWLSPDGTRLRVHVEAPEGSAMRANLREGRAIAVTLTLPSSYDSVQLKGRIAGVGAAQEDEAQRIARHVEAFVADTAAVGMPEVAARATVGTDLVAVDVDVTDRFDQTPGPGAGRRL